MTDHGQARDAEFLSDDLYTELYAKAASIQEDALVQQLTRLRHLQKLAPPLAQVRAAHHVFT